MTYSYVVSVLNSTRLVAEILVSVGQSPTGITSRGTTCEISFVAALTTSEKSALDAVMVAHDPTLADAKAAKIAAIDARTGQLIATGFDFLPTSGGGRFSLSPQAQSNLLGLDALRNDPALTYPVRYNRIDDSGVYEIPNAGTMHNFFLSAVATYRGHLDTGTLLKDQVRAAATVAAVNAVVDSR